MSERGGGTGVTISGAHTVTAEGGAELLHACQSLCRGGSEGGQNPGTRQHKWTKRGREEERDGEKQKERKVRETNVKKNEKKNTTSERRLKLSKQTKTE